MRNTLTSFQPSLLIEILHDTKSSSQKSNCEDLLKDLGYNKYFIDDDGNLSKNEINADRMNYFFTTQPFAHA